MTKDNIMKLSDGMFHKVFKEIASEYPELTSDHYIIDIGSARLATSPERFDVPGVFWGLPHILGHVLHPDTPAKG
jgi:isocitrate dehydrogenase